MVKLTY